MTLTHLSKSRDLDSVNDLIHDHWFNVEELVYYADSSTLEIPFCRQRTRESNASSGHSHALRTKTRWVLRIHSVISYSLEDTERVRDYDFNEVRHLAETGEIIISTGVPLDLRLRVREVEISVEESDQPC